MTHRCRIDPYLCHITHRFTATCVSISSVSLFSDFGFIRTGYAKLDSRFAEILFLSTAEVKEGFLQRT